MDSARPDERDQVLAWGAVLYCSEREGEGGFVEPFISALGFKSDPRGIWDRYLRVRVFDALKAWCGRSYEVGFMKYVGQVRIHAGVPRPLEPRLAELLYELAVNNGLDLAGQLTTQELDELIDQKFLTGRFAKEYLHSQAGRDFLVSCAIHLHRAGWPGRVDHARLAEEPGYREGFYTDLCRHLDVVESSIGSPIGTSSTSRDLFPQLFLDQASYRIGLRFPGLKSRPDCQYQVSGRRHVRGALFPGALLKATHGRYEGQLSSQGKTEQWAIPAWPRTKSSWALFSLEGEWVGCDGETSAIAPGTYLAAIDPARVKPSNVIGTLGYLDPIHDDFGEFELLEVEHGAVPAIPGVGLLSGRGAIPKPTLKQSPEEMRFSSYVGSQVAFGKQACFELEPWSVSDGRYFSVVLEKHGKRIDLSHKVQLHEGRGYLSIEAAPHEGVLKVEARGRHAGTPSRTVYYALWPVATRVKFDKSVYGVEEIAHVEVESGPAVEIKPAPSCTVDLTEHEVHFELSTGVEGSDRFKLDLTIPVPRVSLRAPGERDTVFILDPIAWAEENRLIGAGDGVLGGLVLTVRGDVPWSLCLEQPNDQVIPLAHGDERVRHPGRLVRRRLPYTTIQTQLSQAGPLGRFMLNQAGRSADLGAIMLNTKALSAGPVPELPGWLTGTTTAALSELRLLQLGSTPCELVEDCPEPICNILLGWRRVAGVVCGDSQGLAGDAESLAKVIDQSKQQNMSPTRANELQDQLARIELATVMSDAGLPGIEAPQYLESALKAVKMKLAERADAIGVIQGGIEGVLERVGEGRAVPQPLRHALMCYQDAFAEGISYASGVMPIIQCSDRISPKLEPWHQVAEALHAITLLRLGYVEDYLSLMKPGMPGALAWIQAQLEDPQFTVGYPESEWDLRHVSPLEDDQALCDLCSAQPHHPASQPSWLYLYISWRISGRSGSSELDVDRESLAHQLLGSAVGSLPGTIDVGERLREEVAGGSPRAWSAQ